ncbi:MAG: hypothetical protein ABS34_06280 [Opitutaceae bacterium BACL24 MAG-120322-bin51]|jgi:hypothetical protein|nr:MAG: hypothetical protein ABS34_06280 [Opitutaceae bacterium BACL24 MAG-120322-bin51]
MLRLFKSKEDKERGLRKKKQLMILVENALKAQIKSATSMVKYGQLDGESLVERMNGYVYAGYAYTFADEVFKQLKLGMFKHENALREFFKGGFGAKEYMMVFKKVRFRQKYPIDLDPLRIEYDIYCKCLKYDLGASCARLSARLWENVQQRPKDLEYYLINNNFE